MSVAVSEPIANPMKNPGCKIQNTVRNTEFQTQLLLQEFKLKCTADLIGSHHSPYCLLQKEKIRLALQIIALFL